MKKKTLSLILALLMVFSLLPVSALAANTVQSGSCGDNMTWKLDDAGVLTITGTGEMTERPWLSYKDSIKTVVIGDGVTSIFSGAFSGCTGLTSLVIPSNVEGVGPGAFCECTALKSVNIEAALPSISIEMFRGCSSLESVCFSSSVKSIESGAFAGCDALKEIYFDGTDMQWAVMDIKEGNEALDLAEIHFALDYPFTDIADSGYREYISLGQAVGIVNGYEDGTFRPNNTVTRAQYITMLYNMCDKPDVSGLTLDFKDKNSISGSYLNAVKWGVALGIIKGYDDNTFRPDQGITRAQMAAFIYRLMVRIAGEEAPDD